LRRILSLLLILSLCLILPSPALGEDRPVLTIADSSGRSGNRFNDQLGMWQYLEDLVGVDIEYVYLSAEEYDSAIASGDLPDIVTTQSNLSTILESGVALDVDPYLEEYCPNFLQGDTRLSYDVLKQLGGNDGFYFFPSRIGYNGVGYDNECSSRGYVVRWDYYKELGYPPINNEDDYLNVLLQMHKNHPFTEEGDPTFLYGTDRFNGYDVAFRTELSICYWPAYKYQNNIFTNEVYDGYTDPEHSKYWAAMAWHNKVYRAGKEDGSYDMDLFTQSVEQFEAKCARGQYLGLHNTKNQLYKEKIRSDPDTLSGYSIVPGAPANYYTNVYQLLGNGTNYMWFISANTHHMEEALKLFNYMCDPDFLRELCMGRQGETWDYDEKGIPHMTEYGQEQLDAFKAGKASEDNYFTRWGTFSKLPSNWPLLRDNATHPKGFSIDFSTISREYEIATMTNNISRDICEHYGVELPTDAHYKAGGMDFRNDCGEAISSSISSLTRDQLRIISEVEDVLDDVQVDLIVAETDAEWNALRDKTIRKLIGLGELDVFKAYRQKWDAAAAVICPLVREAQISNDVEPYSPEDYAGLPGNRTEGQQQ
jgi:ABC-type glycerol-3-phosphate transport system substrate-binding protein